MAKSRRSPSHEPPQRPLLYRTMLGALYFGALVLLMLWEARERLDILSNVCEVAQSAPKSAVYDRSYSVFLRWASRDVSRHVSVVAIPADLDELQNNLCLGRAYLADVLRVIAAQHPAEIVIDKFYGPRACASEPEATSDLLTTVQSIDVPIVVGESTGVMSHEVDGSCLVQRPQLDFGTRNVHRGLVRLNTDPERVPLQWRVLPAAPPQSKAEPVDSLAWAAVKAYDPTYAAAPRIQALIDSNRHPYANLDIDLPRQTTTALLCATGTPEMWRRWSPDCSGPMQHPSLLGKVVVIGSENSFDQRVVLGSRMWGFDSQARYIEVLLSGSYLRALPFTVTFCLFAVFVFVIEGLPTLLVAFRPRWKRHKLLCYAYTRRRYVWISFWALFFLVVSSSVSLVLRYFPPLPVLIDIVFISVTRILFFAAESAETPFLHAKPERSVVMSKQLQGSPANPTQPKQPAPGGPSKQQPNQPTKGNSGVVADMVNKPGDEGGTPG